MRSYAVALLLTSTVRRRLELWTGWAVSEDEALGKAVREKDREGYSLSLVTVCENLLLSTPADS